MLAGALLTEAENLLKEGLHAADVLKGYEIAQSKCLELLEKMQSWSITDFKDVKQVQKAVKTAICAKQMGLEEQLSKLLADAVVQVTASSKEGAKFELDHVRVCKIPGGQLSKSFVVDGMVVPRRTMGTERNKYKAKVAVYGSGLEFQQTEAKGTVLLENAEQLMNFSKGEEAQMEEFAKQLAEAGVSVVISGGAVSEIAMHFMDKYKILVVKIGSKFELRRFCKSLKAVNIIRAGPPMPEELGYADSVTVEEIASQQITVFRAAESKISTVVLRGATANTLDEWGRAMDDATNVVRAASKDPRFCPGGAATEIELSRELAKFGATVPGLDQYAVCKFAEALEIVPKMLADNVGKKSRVEILTGLYESHEKGNKAAAIDVDLETEKAFVDANDSGILDHLETKKWAVRHALEAVLTVLRVDHIIMAKQAGQKQG
jgi:T-complex protein 1 subunit theta